MIPVLYICGGFLLGTFADSWKPLLGFKPPPPTAQVTQLQAQLAQVTQQAEQKTKALETAKDQERSLLEAQVQSAQVDNEGVIAAIKKAPPSPEAALALRMAGRVGFKLATAVGRLPEDQRQPMLELINAALSEKQAEVDAAYAKLAESDKNFKAVTTDRDQLKAVTIPELTKEKEQVLKDKGEVQAKLTEKTSEVVAYADKADAAERKAGSFLGALSTLRHWVELGVIVAAGLYLLVHVFIPIWSQSYPNSTILAKASAAAKNLTTAHI